jgi:hypothetical protein
MLIAESLCTAAKWWLDDAALWDLNWERCMASFQATHEVDGLQLASRETAENRAVAKLLYR